MRQILIFIISAILFLNSAGFASPHTDAVHKLLKQADTSGKPKIAVLPVTDLSARSSINKKALYGEIIKTLHSGSRFSVIDRSLIKEILEEKELAMAGIVAADDTKIGNLAGADYILSTVIEQGIVELKMVRTKDGMVGAYTFYKISDNRDYNPALNPGDIRVDTGWISGSVYQAYFDTKLKFGYFPVEVHGRTVNGAMQFRGTYKINLKGVLWYTHHGITKQFFSQQSAKYRAQGFKLNYKSTFKDHKGNKRFNAVWVKK